MAEVLFVVFLVLKLMGTIDWSWWAVTAPLWITYGVWLIAITLVFILQGIAGKSRR